MKQATQRTAVAGRGRATRTPPTQRRELLLDAAEQLPAEGGSHALRMDALARAGGVTRPVVYDHFGDRDGLVIAPLQRHAELVRTRVAAATGTARPPTGPSVTAPVRVSP